MNLDSCLILEREDLLLNYQDKNIIDIEYHHFKHDPSFFYKSQSIVIFVDNNSETKIIKNRYGYEGLVVR